MGHVHDENYVPEPGLPGEEGETGDGPGVEPGGLNPGDTSTWPQGPWTPPDTQKPDTPPDAAEPSGDPEPGGQTESPEEPDEEPDDRTGTGEPQEPDEPNLPDEPTE